MPYRPKKRTPPPSDQMKELFLGEVIRYQGNLDSLRKGHGMTRREANAKLFYILALMVFTIWRYVHELIVRQGNTESMLAEMRKQPQRERARTNSAGNGGFAA